MILKAKNIHKSFIHPIKTKILQGIDLDVRQGETVSIMGRSGEGKSTLLHILGTLEKACQGDLEIAGHDTVAYNQSVIRNKYVGFIFQSFHLLEDCTALENVLMPAKIARRSASSKSEAFQHAEYLLEAVGLSERIHHNVKQLSGGEKQRVAIARSLCNDPDLILADEPSGNLDKKNAEMIYEILFSFVNTKKKSLIAVTHDDALAKMCETKYQLQNGLLATY